MNPAVSPTTIDTLPRFPRQVLNSIIIHVRGEEFIQKGNPEGKKKFGPLRTTPPFTPLHPHLAAKNLESSFHGYYEGQNWTYLRPSGGLEG